MKSACGTRAFFTQDACVDLAFGVGRDQLAELSTFIIDDGDLIARFKQDEHGTAALYDIAFRTAWHGEHVWFDNHAWLWRPAFDSWILIVEHGRTLGANVACAE